MPPTLQALTYEEISSNVATRLAGGRGADPLEPWAEEVVVASNGVSQSIVAAMLEHFPGGVAALRLHSIETLAGRIVNSAGEFPRIAGEDERRLAMRTATRSLDDPLTATRGAAGMLERSYRDLRDSGLSLADFSRRVTGARALRNRDRIRLAIRVWQSYEQLIGRLGAVDPAGVLARATDLVASGTPVALQIVAGFYDMTGAQLGLIRALQQVEKLAAVFVPFDGEGYEFAERFVRHFSDAGLVPQASGLGTGTLRESATREDEVRSACREIATLLAAGETSIGVVARSLEPYDVQLFERFSRESGFAISECVPRSLSGHRFGRTVLQLLRIRERNFPRADVLEIVRSGLRLASRINAEKADYETRRASIAGGRSADLRRRTYRAPIIDDYIIAVEELEELTGKIDFGWLSRLTERFRTETEIDLAAVEALQNIAAIFIRGRFDAALLPDAIESAELPRPEARDPRPVWLGDVMRLRGRSFKHLFAVRMQEDVLPQRRVEDPLLVDADRRILGVREIGDGHAEEMLLFRLMRGAAESITYSVAVGDGFGRPLRRSPYLRGFRGAPVLSGAPPPSAATLGTGSAAEGGGAPLRADTHAAAAPHGELCSCS